MIKEYQVSISRACRVVDLHKSMWYYSTKKDDGPVINKLNELAEHHPTRGFDDYFNRLRNEGLRWNRKRVLRIYRNMGLTMK